MDSAQYTSTFFQLRADYLSKVDALHNEYVENNARFNIGDFVGSGLGIVKVETIDGDGPALSGFFEGKPPTVRYIGKPYRKLKGQLVRVKDLRSTSLNDYDNNTLKLINVTEQDGFVYYKPTAI